jgi:phosphate acetyltransferase
MTTLDRLISNARKKLPRILLPESDDNRILEAAIKISSDKVSQVVLLGNEKKIAKKLLGLGVSRNQIEVIDANNPALQKSCAEVLWQKRKHKNLSLEDAQQSVKNPIVMALVMLHHGEIDGVVAGAITTTQEVVRSALQIVSMKQEVKLLSSFFLMLFEDEKQSWGRELIFSDCAVNIEPNSEQLADIAASTVESAKKILTVAPKVAFLSFSTRNSVQHDLVTKVRKASEICQRKFPDVEMIGDVQLDAALDSEVLKIKFSGAKFNTPANVLIFPSLEAGNIGYKLVQRFAQAIAIGPILQGLNKPVNDLSRGCAVEEIVNTVLVTANQVD